MIRFLKIVATLIGALAGLVLLLVAVLLIGANTAPGRHLIETEANALTGGAVHLTGLGGRFPDRLRIARIELTDAKGPWLTVEDAALDWHPLALLDRTVSVDRLAVSRIDAPRLAEPSPAKPRATTAAGGHLNLPLGLRVAELDLRRVDVGAAIAGHPVSVAVAGHATIASLQPILAGPTLDTLPATDLRLVLTNRAGPGAYALDGQVTPGAIALHLTADEPRPGLVASVAGSGQIVPLHLDLSLTGPHAAEVLHAALNAGPLTLTAQGLTDLVGNTADLTLSAHAPAMQPAAGVSWQSVALDAHVAGPFRTPQAGGHLDIEQLAAAGARIGAIRADLSGNRGQVAIRALVAALRIPGPKPGLFAAKPLTIEALARLDDPSRPVAFSLSHPLLSVVGSARTANPIAAHLTLDLPSLAPLAAAAGVDLAGRTHLTADISANGPDDTARLDGTLALTGGLAPVRALIGNATLSLAAAKHGQSLSLDHLTLDGAALHLEASGGLGSGRLGSGRPGPGTGQAVLAARFHLGLPKLATLSPAVRGHLTIDGEAHGLTTDLAATIHAAGEVGAEQVPAGPIALDLAATHLPSAPEATVQLAGRLDAAPVTLSATAARSQAGATTVQLAALNWKTTHATADLQLAPGAKLPTGKLDLAVARLSDLDRLAHQSLAGAVAARLDLGADAARLDVRATGLAASTARIGRLTLAGTIHDPQTAPDLNLALGLDDLAAGAVSGNASATARGPLDALALALKARVPDLGGAPADLATTELLDLPKSQVLLRTLAANWHGETVALQAPSRITYSPDLAVQRLRLALGDATLSVDGDISPRLRLQVALRNVTPALAKPFAPTLIATGLIAADAQLTGTTASPAGDVRLTANNLHLSTGPAAALPPGNLTATTRLAGETARLDAHFSAGPRIDLRADGTVPIRPTAPLDMRARGNVDLAVANPILEQSGRHLTGRLTLDATATGTTAHPTLAGAVGLANGDLQDYTQGAHLTAMNAAIELAGQTVRIESFSAHAGNGTVTANGTVGALDPTLPVDLHLAMANANPIASDLLSATLNANLSLTGQAAGALKAGGQLTIDRADINIPNGLPPSVATLHVIRPGDKPPAPPSHATTSRFIALDLAVHAPGEIFVRGHGLDATLGGDLAVTGTAQAPVINGGFQLRRGSFSLAGVNLTFTRGDVGFNGTTNGKLDPTLDFAAQSVVNQYTAELDVTGYASKPKISLSSMPILPQDQVMALLLFGTETSNLSPLQIAQIAAALASLSGGGGGFDPLGAVRNTLGLDKLSVGSGTGNGTNTGASIEGGKYITKRVYVGARQSTAGGGTQALVQIDLTKRLKAFTTVGTGGTVTGATTPENDPGSSVGLKYQFRY